MKSLIAFLLFVCASAFAQMPPTVGVHVGTHHFAAESWHRDFNPGVYARWDSGLTVGTYANSMGRQTVYGGWTWERGPFAFTAAVATGYSRKRFDVPCAGDTTDMARRRKMYDEGGPSACWQEAGVPGRFNLLVLPSVLIADHVRLSFAPHIAGKTGGLIHLSLETKL